MRWLLLLITLILMVPVSESFTATVKIPQTCPSGCGRVDVTQFGVLPNDGKDDSAALNQLFRRVNKNAVVVFPAGTYEFASTVSPDKLQNVVLQGERGTVWKKRRPFKGEYLFSSRFSKNVTIRGFAFQGLTTNRNAYAWGEQGLFIGTSDEVLIEGNAFRDFGDAAIRMTTSQAGQGGTGNSNMVVQNNTFDNVTQITTTSNKNEYGGTAGYLLQGNTFRNLKGSVKFATRAPGSGQVIMVGNRISGTPSLSTSTGIEVVSYSNVFIENNTISDCGNFGINIYTNSAAGLKGFDWGNYRLLGNTITRCPRGIRISAAPYASGYKPKVRDVYVLNNSLSVGDSQTIRLVGGPMEGVVMQGNKRLTAAR